MKIKFFQKPTQRERIRKALKIESNPHKFDIENLSEIDLKNIVHQVNRAPIHFSANCVLLSRALLYNLKIGKVELTVGNTYPIVMGTRENDVDDFLFGKPLTYDFNGVNNFTIIEKCILRNYQYTNERIYSLSFGKNFSVLGNLGHAMNAVVLGVTPRVVFVDPWKTTKCIFTALELNKKFGKVDFVLQYYPGVLEKTNDPLLLLRKR